MTTTTYTITVEHGEHSRPINGPKVPGGGSQQHAHLDARQAEVAVHEFLTDLFRHHGAGVKRITITAERREGGE